MHTHLIYFYFFPSLSYLNGSTIKTTRDAYIKKLNGIYLNNLKKDNVEYISGHAKFTGPKEVTVGSEKLTAERILIATGTKPIIPNVPGTLCTVQLDFPRKSL